LTYSKDLLDSARRLIGGPRARPKHSDCNRAVSTIYYAVFDHLCRTVANKIVGPVNKYSLPSSIWVQVYRSIDHRRALDVLKSYSKPESPTHLKQFATHFVRLQNARIDADYHPAKKFSKITVEDLIKAASSAIDHLDSASKDDMAGLIVALVVRTSQR
jgi:uncharacterized protein (UPF0332 family)